MNNKQLTTAVALSRTEPWHVIAALVAALTISAGCSTTEKAAPPPPGVTVIPVLQKDVPLYQEWVGTMVGNVDADIRPKVDGFLLSRLYTEGSYVEKGQTLFQLDPRQTQAALDEARGKLERARAALAQAQIDVRRYTPLVAQKAVSQAELDKALSMEKAATAEVEADQAALNNAQLNLGWTTVTSPISGIAGIAKVGIGDLMTPITVMTTVSSVDPIYVDINIAEQDYLRFRREKSGEAAGQNLGLILGDGTAFPRRGRALFVNREVDSRTGTIQVRAEFPNPGNVLLCCLRLSDTSKTTGSFAHLDRSACSEPRPRLGHERGRPYPVCLATGSAYPPRKDPLGE